MNKETLDKIEHLRYRIEERLEGKNVEGENGSLNADELNELLKSSFGKYNALLLDKVEKDVKSINKLIGQGRLFNRKIPYIASIIPTVYEDGREEIIVTFEYDRKCKGIAVVDRDLNITFEFMKNDFSIDDTMKFLNRNRANFAIYFQALDEFVSEFPNIGYEWNTDNPNVNNIYEVDDGFISVKFDLSRVEHTKATLSRIEDLELARIKSKEYGELYDYVEFYNRSILKSVSINEDTLNPLYKSIVDKSRSESQATARVLKK